MFFDVSVLSMLNRLYPYFSSFYYRDMKKGHRANLQPLNGFVDFAMNILDIVLPQMDSDINVNY